MNTAIESYNESQEPVDRLICEKLACIIDQELTEAESKIWHAHPVWFLGGNPNRRLQQTEERIAPDVLEWGRL